MVGIVEILQYECCLSAGKANVVADGISWSSIESVSLVDEGKKDLVKDVHRLDRLGVRL